MDEQKHGIEENDGGEGMLKRKKYWSERSIEEKLEYLRETLRMTHFRAERAERELRELKVKFEQHAHMPNGEVGVPARDLDPFSMTPLGYQKEHDPLK